MPKDTAPETTEPRYLREEVYVALRSYIAEVAGNASQTLSLREADLARTLGVSRTPVREALNRLHQEGFVTFQPRRGAQVLPATMDEYICWLEISEAVEGLSASRAAQVISESKIVELRTMFDPFRNDEPDTLEFAKANVTFHQAIVEASGNPLLIRLSRTYDHIASAKRNVTGRLGRVSQSLREHDAILDAFSARNSELAERLMREHIKQVRIAAMERLAKLDP
jgi:DNA-binding GntR family transcriptional regulator